jgi:hypothetical protein
VVDLDHVAIAAAVPAGAGDGAVRGRIDRRSISTGKVDSRVEARAMLKRIGADAEATGEFDAGLDRLVRRNRDNAILQLVELLPAVEQRLEGGVAGALERTADTVRAAVAGRADAEPLQLCGGILIADVERLRDERHHDEEKDRLHWSRDPEAAQPRTVVNEQIAVPKQRARRGQNLRHEPLAPKPKRRAGICTVASKPSK